MHCLVFTDTDLNSITKGKSYLTKQNWRRFTCLRDQCYDVGCHPCNICVFLLLFELVSVFVDLLQKSFLYVRALSPASAMYFLICVV